MPDFRDRVLDCLVPTDFSHIVQYPGSALRMLQRTVAKVEQTRVRLPRSYHAFMDQGGEGACCGFGGSICMSILNRKKYDARWLYHEAQLIDEYPETPPWEGTSLRAMFDVLREKGHKRWYAGQSRPVELDEGIVQVNRWLTSVDEIRTAVSEGMPVVLGINWYNSFYDPVAKHGKRNKQEWWIGLEDQAWGPIAGRHCIVLDLASDARQAFGLLNSWGESFPWPTWVSYNSMARLLAETGEAAIVVDK